MSDHEPMLTTATEAGRAAPHPTAEISLLIDVGSAWTKASVVGRTRGRWRIVSHAAQPTNWGEKALIEVLTERMREAVDHRLRDEVPAILESAARITCHTPARPGRLGVAAVTAEVSGSAARRAAESAGWVVVEEAAADDGRSLPERLTTLTAADVDAWLVVGGFDDARPEQALEAAALVAAARRGGRTPVIWAGSAALSQEVSACFEPGVVAAIPNPRPDAGTEDLGPLRHHLEELFDRLVESGGTRNLAPFGFRRTIGEIAREDRLRVVGVDLGARYATWAYADGTLDPVSIDSRVYAAGGMSSPSLTTTPAIGRLARSLALPVDELAVADTLQNIRARPASLPYSDEELQVVHAAARLRLAALVEERMPESIDLLIGSGRVLAAAPTPMRAMRVILDGLRPPGVTQIVLDGAGVLSPLGSLPDEEIGEGISVLRDDLLVPLGTAVVTRGGRSGQLAIRARLHRVGWPDPETVEVRAGQVLVMPLPRGERAELDLELEGGATLPVPRRAHRLRAEVTGGAVGVVLDARDVPLTLPRRLDDRREVIAGWLETLLREPVPGRPRAVAPERETRRGLRRFRVGRDAEAREDTADEDEVGDTQVSVARERREGPDS
jgi:MutL-like protein